MVDLFPYTASPEDEEATRPERNTLDEEDFWLRQMPTTQPLEIEGILDTQVAKRTRRKDYLQYLVKWKNRPIEVSSWLDATQIKKTGYLVDELMERSHDFLLP